MQKLRNFEALRNLVGVMIKTYVKILLENVMMKWFCHRRSGNIKASAFYCGKLFQLSLTFEGDTGAPFPLGKGINFKLCWKSSFEKNTLAYFLPSGNNVKNEIRYLERFKSVLFQDESIKTKSTFYKTFFFINVDQAKIS